MKTSFFKEYFRLRLKELRGFFIASCVLNLLCGPLQVTTISLVLWADKGNIPFFNGYGSLAAIVLPLYLLFFTMPALLLMGIIIPITSRKMLNRRAYVDTLGALPLTFKQRYWGDLLAEYTAYLAPAVPSILYTIVMMNAVIPNLTQEEGTGEIIACVTSLAITLFLSYVAAIALSNFMAQCCGKISSGLFYSLATGVFLPVIVMCFTVIAAENAIGVDATDTAINAGSAVPPFGVLFSLFMIFGVLGVSSGFSAASFASFIAIPLIIAAFIVGGYFVGKKRKAELVGQKFLFDAAASAISIIIAASVLGVFLANVYGYSLAKGIVIALIVTFVIFAGFEVLHRGKAIKLVQSLVKYVCVCAVGLGFFAIARYTHGFGVENRIPSANEVREVSVKMGLFYGTEFNFNNEMAVEVVTREHKQLLKLKNALSTGNYFTISYKLKNGDELKRMYTTVDKGAFTTFAKNISNLPQTGNSRMTVLSDKSVDLSFVMTISSHEENEYYKEQEFLVKPEKCDELREILMNEILIHCYDESNSIYCDLSAQNNSNGERYYFPVNKTYSNTIEFLENPDNLTEYVTGSFNSTDNYNISLDYLGNDSSLSFGEDTGYYVPEELFALFTEKEADTEYSKIITIQHNYKSLYIRKSDEKRAIELFFQAIQNRDFIRYETYYYDDKELYYD
ncbi:MAG: hypothetical protein ACI4JY_01715 [Oscillospiraceae bacterium]